ncbi:MAG: lipid-A-disaccharide synthase [Cyclobacteriaceae bacterium]
MRYYIIAGEPSGDLHGSNLIKSILRKEPEAKIRCWGGDLMQAAGGELVVHYREMAFMGFLEVLLNIRTILKRLKFCKDDLTAFDPDVLILIDYPGFNLRMARYAKDNGMKVCYYISPKVWAWKQSRVRTIKEHVDRMFVILPFEEGFYQQFDYHVDYVGNPLVETINRHQVNVDFRRKHNLGEGQIIAVLPGSRRQELKYMLSMMIAVAEDFPDFIFVVAGMGNLPSSYYSSIVNHPRIKLILDQTYDLLAHSYAALVTSGTATLETALFEVPQVVCYKTSWISYQIGRRLVKVSFISLVNLIAEKEVVKELIQHKFNKPELTRELTSIASETNTRKNQLEGYKLVKDRLTTMNASDNATELLLDLAK